MPARLLPTVTQLEGIKACCPLEVSSFSRALDGAGGDIWGARMIAEGRVMLYIADFAGHGSAVAPYTIHLHSLMETIPRDASTPACVLARLNRSLLEVLKPREFATMFCATLDFNKNTIEYACAGTEPQLYRPSSEKPFELISKPALPLGIMADAAYTDQTAPFLPGGALLLYTDALIETPKPPRSIFTPATLRNYLNETIKTGDTFEVCQALVRKICPDETVKIDDDLTLIAARYTGGTTIKEGQPVPGAFA